MHPCVGLLVMGRTDHTLMPLQCGENIVALTTFDLPCRYNIDLWHSPNTCSHPLTHPKINILRLAFYYKINMAAHGRNLAYYILVVLTTFCGRAVKMKSVLLDATIQNDAESFLSLFKLCTGFDCDGVRKSMFTLCAALLQTERQLSGTLWCLTLSRKNMCSLSQTYSRFCVPTWGWNSSEKVSA